MPTSEIVYLAIAEIGECVRVRVCVFEKRWVTQCLWAIHSIDSIEIMITFNRRCETALSQTVPDKPTFNP